MDLEKICTNVVDLSRSTGGYIISELGNRGNIDIESKGLHNYVTRVDKASEERIIKGLMKILPSSGFIAEEGSNGKRGERYNWIIDPLDGTTNFIHGLPPYAISIALAEHNRIILGVVYEMGLKECFYAWEGGKSYLNGKEIHVSNVKKVNDSLIATGFPYYNYSYLDNFMTTVRFFMENSHGLRRLGSAATDIAYVACGRFEAFYEYGLNPWDVAAGVIILKQADGEISDFKGGTDYLYGGEIIATNANIHTEFLGIINHLMVNK